jgi:hypothetical protein
MNKRRLVGVLSISLTTNNGCLKLAHIADAQCREGVAQEFIFMNRIIRINLSDPEVNCATRE